MPRLDARTRHRIAKGTLWAALLATPAFSAQDVPPESLVRELREARIAIARGDRGKARDLLKASVAAHPKEILPILALSAYYHQTEPDPEELAGLRVMLRQRLSDPEAALPSGSIRALVEDPEVSDEDLVLVRKAIEARLESSPNDVSLLDALARLRHRIGDTAGERAALDRLLKLRPSEYLLWKCADLDRSLGRWESMITLLRRIREGSGDTPWIRLELTRALGKTGHYEDMMKEAEPLAADPTLRLVACAWLVTAAWSLRDAERPEDAERTFRKALELDPANAEARDAVLYFYASEQERRALAAAQQDKWSHQEDPFALQTEGVSRLSAGDTKGAYELLKRCVEKLPDSETAWFNFGLAAFRLERWEDARKAMDRAASIKPDFPNAHLNLGAALQKLDRCTEAISELTRALSLDPSLRQAHVYLYHCYKARGDELNASREMKLSNPDSR